MLFVRELCILRGVRSSRWMIVGTCLTLFACRDPQSGAPPRSPQDAGATAEQAQMEASSRAGANTSGDVDRSSEAKIVDARFSFVGAPPSRVGDLEAALRIHLPEPLPKRASTGSLLLPLPGEANPLSDEIARLSATYVWDLYHQDAITDVAALRARALVDYSVHFARGRAPCEAALRATYGAPSSKLRAASDPWRQYGPFFVDAKEGDAFVLAWYAKEPDWAAPSIDPDARLAAVRSLTLDLPIDATAEHVDRVMSTLPKSAGVVVKKGDSGDYGLELVPPMLAKDFTKAIGAPNAVGQSSDVHRSSWQLVVPSGQGDWTPARFGAWELAAYLDSRPSGGQVSEKRGPIPRLRLGQSDKIRYIGLVLRNRR